MLGRLTREATGEDSIAYEYDKNNNRSSMIVTQNAVDKTTNYHYNENDELLSEATEDEGVKQITNYWYDLNGNQIAKSYANVVTNGANVVVPVEPSSAVPEASASVSATSAPETDAIEENITAESNIGVTIQATTDNPEGAQPQLTEYDALNRQTKVKIGNDVYKYGYNEDGLRTWKEVNGEKTYFVWDDDQIVLELDENGAVNKKHVRGLTLLYSEDDSSSTNDKVFYNYNAHGDVVQLLNEAGTVTKYYQYDSFGNEINEDENDENPWRYCGEYYDKETGTIYLRARYYNPGYGRFTTRDTYTGEQNDPLSLNLYTYCENEPVMNVDPSGRSKEPIVKKFKQMAICTDGAPANSRLGKSSSSHQNQTAYTVGGKSLDARKIRYVVVPMYYTKVQNGDIAIVVDKHKKKYLYAIVGERGPLGAFNEVSAKVAWSFGYSFEEANGSNGPCKKFETWLLPKSKRKKLSWKYKSLNKDVRERGEKIKKKRNLLLGKNIKLVK